MIHFLLEDRFSPAEIIIGGFLAAAFRNAFPKLSWRKPPMKLKMKSWSCPFEDHFSTASNDPEILRDIVANHMLKSHPNQKETHL